eukprot:Opistho-2@34640
MAFGLADTRAVSVSNDDIARFSARPSSGTSSRPTSSSSVRLAHLSRSSSGVTVRGSSPTTAAAAAQRHHVEDGDDTGRMSHYEVIPGIESSKRLSSPDTFDKSKRPYTSVDASASSNDRLAHHLSPPALGSTDSAYASTSSVGSDVSSHVFACSATAAIRMKSDHDESNGNMSDTSTSSAPQSYSSYPVLPNISRPRARSYPQFPESPQCPPTPCTRRRFMKTSSQESSVSGATEFGSQHELNRALAPTPTKLALHTRRWSETSMPSSLGLSSRSNSIQSDSGHVFCASPCVLEVEEEQTNVGPWLSVTSFSPSSSLESQGGDLTSSPRLSVSQKPTRRRSCGSPMCDVAARVMRLAKDNFTDEQCE